MGARNTVCSYSNCDNKEHTYKYKFWIDCSTCNGTGSTSDHNSAGILITWDCRSCLGRRGEFEDREAQCSYCERHCDGSSKLHPALDRYGRPQ